MSHPRHPPPLQGGDTTGTHRELGPLYVLPDRLPPLPRSPEGRQGGDSSGRGGAGNRGDRYTFSARAQERRHGFPRSPLLRSVMEEGLGSRRHGSELVALYPLALDTGHEQKISS